MLSHRQKSDCVQEKVYSMKRWKGPSNTKKKTFECIVFLSLSCTTLNSF